MNNAEKEYIKSVCKKCKNTNSEDCYITKRINGEYDCCNKQIDDKEK